MTVLQEIFRNTIKISAHKIAALKNSELFRDIPTKCFFRKTAGLQLRPLLVNVLQNFNL